MRRTLFLIPHEIAGIPFFGVGWLLAALALYIVVRLTWAVSRPRRAQSSGSTLDQSEPMELARADGSWKYLIAQEGVIWAIFAAIIVLVLPRLELTNVAGDPLGLPIRGYGMFLMMAAVASVSFAAWRADRAGLGAESILRLAPWTFIGGLLGARMFYVVQYHNDFVRDTWPETIAAMAAMTQGGLVVYGGFIGGFLASAWAVHRLRLPLWKLGDVIVPCIFVGLFFGRLGCLMNGCCYGGACEPSALAVQFPPGSSVYTDQLLTGELIGITADPVTDNRRPPGKHGRARTQWKVESVADGSLAEQSSIVPGQTISLILDPEFASLAPPDIPAEDALPGLAVVSDGELIARFSPAQLPARAAPVWATQIMSSAMSAVMLVLLLILERTLNRSGVRLDGILMLAGFIAYAVLRIVIEWVRVDEAGQFGTSLSISQWVSIVVIMVCIIALAFRLLSFRARPAAETTT